MGKNVIFRKNYNSVFLSAVVSGLLYIVCVFIDSALGGTFVDESAFTAITVSGTYCNIVYLLTSCSCMGCTMCIGEALGRGDRAEAERYFSYYHDLTLGISLVLAVVGIFFAPQIAFLIGARDPSIAGYAIIYIRVFSLGVFPSTIQFFHIQNLIVQGYSRAYAYGNMAFLVINLVASLFFLKVVGLGVAGLSLGTIVGRTLAIFFLMIYAKVNHYPLMHWSLKVSKDFGQKVVRIYKKTLPTFCNSMTATLSTLIFNNVIQETIGITGLTAFSIYSIAYQFSCIVNFAIDDAVSMCNSVFFGARDTESMRNTIRYSFKLPALLNIAFSLSVAFFRHPIMALFGIHDKAMLDSLFPGLVLLAVITVLYELPYCMSPFYATTEKVTLSIINAIVPDALLYAAFGVPMVIVFGIPGIWYSALAAAIAYNIGYGIFLWWKNRHIPRKIDDMMLLPSEYTDDSLAFNVSVTRSDENVVGISEKIQNYLLDHQIEPRRAYFAALSLEEMAVVALENQKNRKNCFFDIQVFVSEGRVKLSMRDDGERCNYILYEPKDKLKGIGVRMVRKTAKSVQYMQLLGMNVLNIEL